MTVRKPFVIFLLLLLFLAEIVFAETYALRPTYDQRDGEIYRQDDGATCGDSWSNGGFPTQQYARIGFGRWITTFWYKRRGFFSFDLTNIPSVITSAQLRFVIDETENDDYNNGIKVYCGDCCISDINCVSALDINNDWDDCTNLIETIAWASIPEPYDSVFVDVPTQYVNPGAGHTLDFRLVGSLEDNVCDIGVGVQNSFNYITVFTGDKSDSSGVIFEPILYIEATEANCTEEGRIWLNTSNDSLSFCDGTIIRHLNYEEDWEVQMWVNGFAAF